MHLPIRSVLIVILLLSMFGVAFTQVVKVTRVVDGDTFLAEEDKHEYKVRMLYVDTPESVHPDWKRNVPMGKVASDYTKSRLEGQIVTLIHPGSKESEDRFGRELALVFLHNACYNLELIEKGLSPYYTKYGKAEEPWHTRFTDAEKKARDSKNGIWSDEQSTKKYLRLKSKWGSKKK